MEKASELFKKGYNCAQSVFCAHCKKVGIDIQTGLKLASSFGGGMGRLREVCGAVSAMFMLLGLKSGYTDFDNDEIKEKHYAKLQNLAKKFENEFGSIICRDLLNKKDENISPTPTKRTQEFYHKRPCVEQVKNYGYLRHPAFEGKIFIDLIDTGKKKIQVGQIWRFTAGVHRIGPKAGWVYRAKKATLVSATSTKPVKSTCKQPTRQSSISAKINAAMKKAATESFGYNEDQIVSSDIIGMRFGSLFDATQTMVAKIDDDTYQVQVVSWYDNENSYTSQMVRTIKYFSENC